MKDLVTIEIDCDQGVVSMNTASKDVFSISGKFMARLGRAELIGQCLMPQVRELMGKSEAELKRLSLVAMGVIKE